MPKQINVDLKVNADVASAKKAIADLQSTLSNFSAKTGTSGKIIDSKQFEEASKAAQELKQHLMAATDVNTGKLNLSELSASLKTAGKSLSQYKQTMEAVGTEGQEAFLKVSYAIASAEAPTRRVNGLMKEFSTVMKNTVRWQLSSTMIHGFMGALQSAYGYAQDLNKSLNDIRIVTGQSVDQMTAFADRANKAAQALSASTIEYTNAALIFYQQGLSDDEVQRRTDVTIKMAHAAGESAKEVSSYMTAIWNNFSNGADNLERYGDVITKLGAATAASSAEIAGGLEKFAAVANTVGLSFDYAAAAVTTIVDKTRQSEDVVGTSLKTIFARLEGLQLGKTDEDGTTLNKYSQALLTVGVNIKDTNGELKSMDTILNELGPKWQQLADDQKIALAQTVGGMRQYNQFIALMDNFEAFQENISRAKGSEGELQYQADIYAESWEAASKRAKAAMQSIYQSVLDDKFFIQMTNFGTGITKTIDGMIKGLGGVKGLLSTIASIFMANYAKEMPAVLDRIKQEILLISGKAQDIANNERSKALNDLNDYAQTDTQNFIDNPTAENAKIAAESQGMATLARLKAEYYQNEAAYSEKEKADALNIIRLQELKNEQLKREADSYGNLERALAAYEAKFVNSNNFSKEQKDDIKSIFEGLAIEGATISSVKKIEEEMNSLKYSVREAQKAGTDFNKIFTEGLNQISESSGNVVLKQQLEDISNEAITVEEKFEKVFSLLSQDSQSAQDNIAGIVLELQEMGMSSSEVKKITETLKDENAGFEDFLAKLRAVSSEQQELGKHTVSTSEAIVTMGSTLMMMNSAISSVQNGLKTLGDEDASGLQKLGAIIGMLTTGTMLWRNIMASVPKVMAANTLGSEKNAVAIALEGAAKELNLDITKELTEEQKKELITKAGLKEENEASARAYLEEASAKAVSAKATKTAVTGALQYAGAMALLMAAIYAFIEACKYLDDAINRDINSAKKSAEAVENLGNVYEEMKNKYEELKTSISDYGSMTDSLDKLTKGTKEWRDALIEANAAAMNIIQNANLSPDQYSWQDGRLVIDNGVLSSAEQQAYSNMTQAEAVSYGAKLSASRYNNFANLTNLRRSDGISGTPSWMPATLAEGTAAFGSYAMDIWGLANLFTNNSLGTKAMRTTMSGEYKQMDNINKLAQEYAAIGEAAFEKTKLAAYGFDDASDEFVNGIKEYCKQVKMANDQTVMYSQSIAHSRLEGKGYSDDIINYSGAQFAKAQKEIEAQVKGVADTFGIFTSGSTSEAQALFARYAQATGKNITLDDVTGYGDNIKFTYIDDATNELKEVTKEQLASAIASAEALDTLEDAASSAAISLGGITNENGKSFVENLMGSGYGGSLDLSFIGDYLSTQDIAALGGGYGVAGDENGALIYGSEGKEVFDKLGISMDKLGEIAVALDMDAGQLGEEIRAYSQSLTENIDNLLNDSTLKAFYNQNNISKLDSNSQLNLLNSYKNAIKYGAGDEFKNITKGLDEEKLKTLSKIDWSVLAPNDLVKKLEEAGIDTSNLTDDIYKLSTTMRATSEDGVKALVDSFNEVNKALKGINLGDTISQEDYEKLDDVQKSYFVHMMDGTYQLVGAAEDLLKYTEKTQRAQYLEEAIARENVLNKELIDLQEQKKEAQTKASQAEVKHNSSLGAAPVEFFENHKIDTNNSDYQALITGHYGDDYNTNLKASLLANAGYAIEGNSNYGFTNADGISLTSDQINEMFENQINYQLAREENLKKIEETGEAWKKASEEVTELDNQIAEKEKEIADSAGITTAAMYDVAFSYDNQKDLRESLENKEITDAAYTAAEENLRNQARMEGLDSQEISDFKDYLLETVPALEDNSEAAKDLAIHISQMNKGIEDLNKNWDSWKDALDHPEEVEGYSKAMAGMKSAMEDILDISSEFLSNDFITSNMDNIKKAAEGDVEAIDALKKAAKEDIIVKIATDENSELSIEALKSQLADLESLIPDDIEIGATFDDTEFVNGLNEMIEAAGMSADEVNALLSSMGFEANFVEEKEPVINEVPQYEVHHEPTTNSIEPGQPWSEITWTEQKGTIPVEGKVPAFAMSTDGSVPQIKSITKMGSVGASGATSRKSSGKGGGGSKSSKKDLKKPDDEKERYYTITRQIKDQEDALNRLDKAKNRAFGKAKIDLIDKESEALERELELQDEYLRQISDYQKQDSAAMNFFGAQYDENGVIVNYDEMQAREVANYNAAVEAFNAGGSEDAFKVAEKRYEEYKKALSQYDETNQLWQSEMDKRKDLEYQIYDKKVEKIETQLEINISVNDDALKLIEYRLDRIKDKAFSTAEAIQESLEKLSQVESKQTSYTNSINNVLSNHGINSTASIAGLTDEQIANLGFTDQEVTDLRSWVDGLIDAQREIDEIENAIIDGPLNVTKEWNEEFERLEDNIEHASKIIQSVRNIGDLSRANTGVDDQFLLGLQNKQYGVSLNALDAAKKERDANQIALDAAKAEYEKAVAENADENVKDRLKKNLDEMQNIFNKSEEDMYSKFEETLKASQELLEATVEAAKKQFESLVSATGSMDFDDTIFDHMTKMDEFYLDDYEKIYEFSKLTRDINKSLENESSADNMSRYKEVLQEIQELEESGQEITQYQVDALRKKYELAQAYANLQDSQNAKSQVRMSRDSEGNMSYVYTASENSDDLQRYEDKLYEYQKLNSDYVKEQQKNFRELAKEASEVFSNIAKDTSLSEEEKQKRMAEARQYYNSMGLAISEEVDLALGYNKELYDGYWTWYSDKYDYAISKQSEYQTSFENTILGAMYDTIPSAQSLFEQFTLALGDPSTGYYAQLTQASRDYADNQKNAFETAGFDISTFVEDASGAVDTMADNAEEAAKQVDEAVSAMTEDLEKVSGVYDTINGLNLDAARDQITGMIDSINGLIGKYSELSKATTDAVTTVNSQQITPPDLSITPSSGGGSGGGGGGGGGWSPSPVAKVSDGYPKSFIGTTRELLNVLGSFAKGTNGSTYYNKLKDMNDFGISSQISAWLKEETGWGKNFKELIKNNKTKFGKLFSFDTGGYTGAWNSDNGKLAFLHQKELVLNAKDTENMLAMVDIARSVINTVDGQSLINRINLNTNQLNDFGGKTNDFMQNVQINATFTDATTREEITAAFDTLINRASQYMGRKSY